MTAIELTARARELKELKIMATELAEEITSIEDAIKAELTARGVDELTVDVFKIRWISVVSQRFDTKAFQANHASLYNQFVRPIETRRFSIN